MSLQHGPAAILHLGAPKCGSSALQAALSAQPDLTDMQGRELRYVAAQPVRGRLLRYRGDWLQRAAAFSPYGYASWPDLGREVSARALFGAFRAELMRGRKSGYVPILSNEGWIRHPDAFAEMLSALGYPPVEVAVYLRPPLPWMNAAFWQWGVWSWPGFDEWLRRGLRSYSFGADLRRWARIPNLRLHVSPARDVVAQFAADFGIVLPPAGLRHRAAPPALIGFLLRNRRFRRDGHDAALEFVLQRWLPDRFPQRPWAIEPHHLGRLAALTRDNRRELETCLPSDICAALFDDPLWQRECPFLPQIESGPSPLDSRDDLNALLIELDAALEKAARSEGERTLRRVSSPKEAGSLSMLDREVATRIEALTRSDRVLRRRWAWSGPAGLNARAAAILALQP
ncbi:hypothetical protein [Thioclava atlantica]|uniref:Family 2 glycosyl transferase n=1 Tax=Thioclava atlantica TaxID=1317124 RepID=A0A085TRW0_9RHOB|nr:hypothetical protein [Thioclava atlantica]KFE33457.1 family 2 glycosyl transferase [Thioclava atlantica]